MNATQGTQRLCAECGATAIARGLCNPHYKRAARRGSLPPRIDPETERRRKFWSQVEKTPTCWFWRGSLTTHGYGQFGHGIRGLTTRAHRLAWVWENGPLVAELSLDHLCRNRNCVRPDHLEAVTNRVNVLRGIGPTALNARKDQCKRHGIPYIDGPSCRRCVKCDQDCARRANDRLKARRSVRQCGATTRDGKPCRRRVSTEGVCVQHGTEWADATPTLVIYVPEVQS